MALADDTIYELRPFCLHDPLPPQVSRSAVAPADTMLAVLCAAPMPQLLLLRAGLGAVAFGCGSIYSLSIYIRIDTYRYIYIYMCVCVCVRIFVCIYI